MNWFRKALPQPKSDAQVILDALGKTNDLNTLFEAVDRMVDAGSVTELLILVDEIESNGRGERWALESMVTWQRWRMLPQRSRPCEASCGPQHVPATVQRSEAKRLRYFLHTHSTHHAMPVGADVSWLISCFLL